MDRHQLVTYLETIDHALAAPATLVVYGSAALILLDEPDRTSLDVDVAGPYSMVDFADFKRAATTARLPVNPEDDFRGDHIEWIGPLRLCLAPPTAESEVLLWQGNRLTVKTVAPAQLIASKLIRYDEIDRSDIQFLLAQSKVPFADIAAAVGGLPEAFRRDPLVRENLANLKTDVGVWGASR